MRVACLLIAGMFAVWSMSAQTVDANRLRELRQKSRDSKLTPAEQSELDAGLKARLAGRPATPPKVNNPTNSVAREERLAEYAERQVASFERMRQLGGNALAAAAQRVAANEPAREYYVNNESGSDQASGRQPEQAVRSLAKAVSLLKPGDTLHLAVTGAPYRETLRLNDDFGGVPGKPIVIKGHGATLTGCDPLRLDGWVEAGSPGLYKSAKFISELEEFDDAAKLMRVFFMFDGVMQHMGRSSKGAHARFKAPADLQPGEWTYVETDKTFYLCVTGKLADAKIEAPYRRNGVAIRAPKVAVTHLVIEDLIVCHVLNDGFNLHGTTQDVLLKNIAAYECGDDGISPHETCEVNIDGFWSVGNSTGMGNGYLSVTRASNIRLEGNLGHQFMAAHAPVTELHNAVIIAAPGTRALNFSNSQDCRLKLDNVAVISTAGQGIMLVPGSTLEARHLSVDGAVWDNAGTVRLTESAIKSGSIVLREGGTWIGNGNVYQGVKPPPGETGAVLKTVASDPGVHPIPLPPRPVPHPGAGKFTSLPPRIAQ